MQQSQLRGEHTNTHATHSSTSSIETTAAPVLPNFKVAPVVTPTPAYVALAAASQLVTDNHSLTCEQDATDPAAQSSPNRYGGALFSAGGLATINAFLDHLFYNFLLQARGVSLAAIQTAIEHVLKGKLARHAIANANEELEELLSDDADEDLAVAQESANNDTKMDIEAVFWRTRLRVMVYMRLGEMEDEDEEQHVEDAQMKLQATSAKKRISLSTGLVSWAAAIYLTSILEFVAEQCLGVAGQAAYDRKEIKRQSKNSCSSDGDARVIVEEFDVERIALSSTLGRLWRTWRKQVRSPPPRNVSAVPSVASSRKPSQSTPTEDSANRSPLNDKDPILMDKNIDTLNQLESRQDRIIGARRSSKSSAASEEGTRVNNARINRISLRPRSLMIARRISSLDDVSKPALSPLLENRNSAALSRSHSLPSSSTNLTASTLEPNLKKSARPATAPRSLIDPRGWIITTEVTSAPTRSEIQEENHPAELPKDAFSLEQETYKVQAKLGSESATDVQPEEYPNSLLERAVATRKPTPPAPSESRDLDPVQGQQPVVVMIPSTTSATESLTSIEEDGESRHEVSAAVPSSENLVLKTPSDYQANMPVNNQAWPRQHLSSKSSLREPLLKTTPSFDREERSSVRRLSETSSSKQSKLKKSSLETFSSHKSTQGQTEYMEKDFQDFMAAQEPVKYTLTPRTLHEIETRGSSRYNGNGTITQQKRELEHDEIGTELGDLTSAQLAVIANMNASLSSYPTLQNSSHNMATLDTLQATQRSNRTRKAAFHESLGQSGQDPWIDADDVGPLRQDRATQAEPSQLYSGWTSVRTSMEPPRRNERINGTSSHTLPPTISAARKTSTSTLEPRDAGRAMASSRGESDELVQFLRSTGPTAGQAQNGSYARNGDTQTVSSYPQRTSSSMSPSVSASVNSTSAILGSAPRGQVARQMQGEDYEMMMITPPPPPPPPPPPNSQMNDKSVRTRKRIKDPYALPSDDEESDELTELPTRGETLIDFLRNVNPPPHMLYGNGNSTALEGENVVNYTSGASGLPPPRAMKSKGSIRFWKKKVST